MFVIKGESEPLLQCVWTTVLVKEYKVWAYVII